MSHLWITSRDSWSQVPLSGATLALSSAGVRPLEPRDDAPAWLRRVGGAWVLLAARGAVAVNGARLGCGLRVLRDRDELRFTDGGTVFFSTERLATVAPFAGAKPVCCPRCRQSLTPGTLAVVCPACGAPSHQTPELACWTYGLTCPLCCQPSALDAGFRWTPEEL